MATVVCRRLLNPHSINSLSSSLQASVSSKTCRSFHQEFKQTFHNQNLKRFPWTVVNPFTCANRTHIIVRNNCIRGCVFTSFRSFNSQSLSARPLAIHKHISSLSSKRITRKKKDIALDKAGEGLFQATAYSTAEGYDLEALKKGVQDHGLYILRPLPADAPDAMCVHAKYQLEEEPREIYFFREGSVVFWNMPEEERNAVLSFLRKYQEDSYDKALVQEEHDSLDYVYHKAETELIDGTVLFSEQTEDVNDVAGTTLEKYTFSNALALSVKLSIWEASLAKYINSIEYISEDLKMAHKIRLSKAEVLRKTGELFTLRHLINLSSDLLDTPDFYWDREKLERLYSKTCTSFNINLRTRVMNEKLNHCVELTELLRSQLNDAHQARLEVIIIVLILVECLFECIHLWERHWGPNADVVVADK